jgi:hypothetical protein
MKFICSVSDYDMFCQIERVFAWNLQAFIFVPFLSKQDRDRAQGRTVKRNSLDEGKGDLLRL